MKYQSCFYHFALLKLPRDQHQKHDQRLQTKSAPELKSEASMARQQQEQEAEEERVKEEERQKEEIRKKEEEEDANDIIAVNIEREVRALRTGGHLLWAF